MKTKHVTIIQKKTQNKILFTNLLSLRYFLLLFFSLSSSHFLAWLACCYLRSLVNSICFLSNCVCDHTHTYTWTTHVCVVHMYVMCICFIALNLRPMASLSPLLTKKGERERDGGQRRSLLRGWMRADILCI